MKAKTQSHSLAAAEFSPPLTQAFLGGIGSSLKSKATLLGVALAVIPVLIVGSAAYTIASRSLTESIESERRNEAQQLQTLFDQTLDDGRIDVSVIAELSVFTDAQLRQTATRRQQRDPLLRYSQLAGIYGLLAIVNRDGSVQVQSQGDPLPNQRDEAYFQAALEQESTVIGTPFALPAGSTTGGWVIPIAAPIRDSESEAIVGVVYAQLLMRLVDSRLQTAFIAEQGKGYALIDDQGIVFLANDPTQEGQSATQLLPSYSELIAAGTLNLDVGVDPETDQARIETFVPVGRVAGMTTQNWSALITSPAAQVFAPRQQLAVLTIGSTILTAIGVGLIATWLSGRVVKPILNLTEAVERIGQGDLNTRVVIQGQDELSTLGSNINQMVYQLQRSLMDLQQTSTEIQTQKFQVEQESQELQADIGHILDVVSAIEQGNLLTQAEVSPLATGLVADTLNRLVERLGQVLTEVLLAARQVAAGSDTLEQLANTVAQNAQQQAEAVTQTLQLTQDVQHSALQSAEQVQLSNQILSTSLNAVTEGQETIDRLTEGIEILMAGSSRIREQIQSLGEFAELADQFVQEQAQTASLTQTLAMSAALVSARAAEQKDPRQFLSLAREFETIAQKVQELSQQTHSSLRSLRQRTAQVHQTVTVITTDVKSLAVLVNDFTEGVSRSRKVFTNIQTATANVAEAGEAVNQSNDQIVQAAKSTAQTIQALAALAEQTAQLTQVARSQSESMGDLSDRLLRTIQFFQVPGQEWIQAAPVESEPAVPLSS